MEFTPNPSSIFQNKKIKYNNKKPTKNGIIWINFSKIRKVRCTLTRTSLGSHNTACGSLVALRSPIFLFPLVAKTSYTQERYCTKYIYSAKMWRSSHFSWINFYSLLTVEVNLKKWECKVLIFLFNFIYFMWIMVRTVFIWTTFWNSFGAFHH